MTTPATFDIELYQGDSYDLFFRVKARDNTGSLVYQDLTGCTAKAQIRPNAASTTVSVEMSATISDQTTLTGGVLLHITAVQSAALTITNGVWDVQITYPSGDVRTVLAGTVIVTAEVTR